MSGSQQQSSVAPPRSVQANLKNTRAGASVLALYFATPIMVVGPFFAIRFSLMPRGTSHAQELASDCQSAADR